VPRSGLGFDVHAFAPERRLVIGGVDIPYHLGLAGHSDADVLTHAVIDALLGAAGLGDIGQHFPDTDARWKGASSLDLLSNVRHQLDALGWSVVFVDTVIMAQAPRLSAHRGAMQANLARSLGIAPEQVNIRATTTEGLGFIGRVEGVAAQAIATLVAEKGTT
jgi:2-C-methyl-D-erythritol 2,4-cyclodiphosphate synthase